MSKHEEKLHYNKGALIKEYQGTFGLLGVMLLVGIGGALVYFFGLAVYLGGWSHTKAAPYVEEFADRIQYEYKGTKLPMYENPELAKTVNEAEKKAH